MHITQPLHKAMRECPEATATVFQGRRRSWRAFVSRVARLAGALRSLGVEEGDRVGMLARNSDRYLEFMYGVLWAGGVTNPVNVRWSAREIAYSLDDCDTRILLVDDAFLGLVEELRELSDSLRTLVYVGDDECPQGMLDYESLLAEASEVKDARRGGDDLAVVLYTGGTTGTPKGVMLTHANSYLGAIGTTAAAPRPPRIPALHPAPFFHVAGMQGVYALSMRLGTHVVIPMFEPGLVLETIEREKVAETFLVPTMLRMLLDHPDFPRRDLSSLRYMRYGASPMDSGLLQRAMRELPGVGFTQAYGMTELSPTVTMLPPECHTPDGPYADKLMSAGRPVPTAEIRVVDDDDEDLPPGRVGEIVARGPMVMKGYWNKPEQTEAALRNGWMHTGDAGYLDAEGFLFVVDRIKDMIVSGGENVYSAEVEDTILTLPQVAQCAVIGVPDDKWGERVHAVIVLKPGETLTEEALTAHCKSLIAGYKCPRSFELRDELPMSAAGKLLKYKLREGHWRGRERQVG